MGILPFVFFDVGTDPTDLKATFEYDPRYGMDLMVNPSDGQIVSTKNMEGQGILAALFCMRQYHFTYDVRYPIKVTIRDPRAFKGEGYNFFYAFPIFIDNNQPARAFSSSDSFPDLTDELSFCQFVGDEIYEFRAQGYFAEGAPPGDIKEVTINYRCFRQSCILGETDAVRGVYRLVTPLPEGCTNPLIIAEKDGYLKDQKFLTDKYMTLNLIKLKNFTYEVVKHGYNANTERLATEEDSLETTEFKDEKAVIILKLKGDRKHNQYKAFPSNDTMQLVDDTATYDIAIYYLVRDKLVGGYKAEELELTYNEISQGDHIVFHVFDYMQRDDELGMYTYLQGQTYKDALKPTVR